MTTRSGTVSSAVAPRWLLVAAVLLLAVAAHFPALQGGFIWDDDRYVTENGLLEDAAGLRAIWLEPGTFPQYYPLVLTSFWLERHAWGLAPLGYHATNVALHALNAGLVFLVLRALAVPGAWVAAAIFAVHPVHVESVAWVTERKNLLSACFALLAALAYCSWAGWRGPGDPASGRGGARNGTYALSLALFLLALLGKTTAAVFPAVMCVLHWATQGRVSRRDLLRLAPFFALGIALGLMTVHMERTYVGAKGPEWEFSALERLLIAGRALWFYLLKLLWPAELVFSYPRWRIDGRLWWQHLFPLGAAATLALLWALRGRLGRWPLAGALIFAGTLFPALGFFDVFPMRYSFVADHFVYLASIGVIALVPGLALRILGTLRRGLPGAGALPALAAATVLVLATLAWRQAQVYRDQETLWRDTLRKNPGSWLAALNLGVVLLERGELTDATAALFRRSQELHGPSATAAYGLGRIALQEGRADEAVSLFRQAVAIKPEFLPPRFELATALARRGESEEARALYLEVLRVKPDHAKAHTNLGLLLARQGAWSEALSHFTHALWLEPENPQRLNNVGLALLNLGKLADAETRYRESLRIGPDNAETLTQLGAVLLRQGQLGEARERLSAALALKPDHAPARAYLSEVLAAPAARP